MSKKKILFLDDDYERYYTLKYNYPDWEIMWTQTVYSFIECARNILGGKQLPLDYIVSKIVAGKKFDWYEEDLKEYLKQNKELSEDDPDKLPSEIVDYHYIDYSQEEFVEAVYNWNFEMCNMFERPSHSAMLMICAMKWFVDSLKKHEEEQDFEAIVE